MFFGANALIKRNYFILTLIVILWASTFVGIRISLQGYSPGSLALLRFLAASLCMVGIYFKWGARQKIRVTELVRIGVLGIFGFSIFNVALNYGEISVSAGIASFIINQVPMLMTLLAILFLGERLLIRGWLGTVISCIGIVLIGLGENTTHHAGFGVICILIAAIAESIYSVFQKPLLKTIDPINFTAYAIWAGTIVLLFYLPQLINELPRASLAATSSAIYTGIFPAAIGYLLWSYAVKRMQVIKVGSCIYVIPLCAMLMGWLILGEVPALLSAAGGMVTLVGVVLVHRGMKKKTT